MSKKVGATGGNMGGAFDDGVFDGVKKITVAKEGSPFDCVSYIKIEYEKDGKLETRKHGTIRGELKEFSVAYPNEYITSVGGSYDRVPYYNTVLIKSLIFKTNTGRTSPVLGGVTASGKPAGREFLLEDKCGEKLLGFFGRSGQALDAIGAYFGSLGAVGLRGGNNGAAFDDGIFIGVKKIIVAIEGGPFNCISYIKIEYVKDRNFLETCEHGTIRGGLKEFSLDYPNEYITSVGGSYDHVLYYNTVLIKSLIFKTNTGRTSPVLGGVTASGKPGGREFLLKGKRGEKFLGFFGRSGQALDAIGAYFGPLGGIKGKLFDDGVFNGVKNITVGADEFSITYIKIEYEKDRKVVIREHGTNRGELGKFSVDYPKESITAIGGSYNHIFNYDTTLITSLYFTTSKGFTSPLFGKTKGIDFELKGENGEKLLGIYGRGGTAIDAIGAHF
ncbi:Myrosinase-binding protein 2 [Raphanus sativus]|nr:Myrosinase-binding protein 2 [Raphanus sativus]